ncbi:hypothetical protein KQX54_009434 [Cotesia glomerata]|uniref:BEN domain-containing protein n=1 Tax=Cotesia glomerata TaxID=32391 RepID=A0AAV7HDP0_COTGL|nr:hypothetical protein KQX54_009434 [Cotesia glomerata]
MVSRYLLEGSSDEEATRESQEGSINEEATREFPEGCSTEEATLEFNEDTKSREEKSHLSQNDNKSNEEEIQNSGEVTSSEGKRAIYDILEEKTNGHVNIVSEPHPEHLSQSARILNHRELRSNRPENVAGPSNRSDTEDLPTGSSNLSVERKLLEKSIKIMIRTLIASAFSLGKLLMQRGNRDVLLSKDLRHAEKLIIDIVNGRKKTPEPLETPKSPVTPETPINLDIVSDSSDPIDHNNTNFQERKNDILHTTEDDNSVQGSWDERGTSRKRYNNGDRVRDFVSDLFRKSDDYDISNPITPEHAPTSCIGPSTSSNYNVSGFSIQNDSDFIDFQLSNRETINVAQDDDTSQKRTSETSITPELPETPKIYSEASVTSEPSEAPETSETSVISEPPETPESLVIPGTPKTSNTEDDSFSQEHSDEKVTKKERVDDSDQLENSESSEGPYQVLSPRKTDSDNIDTQESSNEMTNVAQKDDDGDRPGPSKISKGSYLKDLKVLTTSESSDSPYPLSPRKRRTLDYSGLAMKHLGNDVYCREVIYSSALGASHKATHLARRLLEGVFKYEALMGCTLTGQAPRGTSKKLIVKPLDQRAKDAIVDFSMRIATEKNWPSQNRGTIFKEMSQKLTELYFTPGKVPGPSDPSDRDNINFEESSDEMIDVGQENMDERAIMTKRDIDDSERPRTSEDLQSDVLV